MSEPALARIERIAKTARTIADNSPPHVGRPFALIAELAEAVAAALSAISKGDDNDTR